MMNDTFCSYDGQRDQVLIAYLYDDIDPSVREAFERHLSGCLPCRTELDALSDVRLGLTAWSAPDVADGVGGTPRAPLRLVDNQPRSKGWRTLGEAPVWMQAAAAMLLVAASLGLANLDVTYSSDGFSVRTGWMRSAPPVESPAQVAPPLTAAAALTGSEPWRAELTALEQRLLQELKAQPASASVSPDEEALLKRVRTLVQDSERRQQSELALRVAEVARDAQTQRQSDLVRIDRSLGLIQSRTGVEVMRTQQQINSLAQRVSQRQ